METPAIAHQVDPRAKTPRTRKIGRNHFAFFRAYLQGIDAMQMWWFCRIKFREVEIGYADRISKEAVMHHARY